MLLHCVIFPMPYVETSTGFDALCAQTQIAITSC
jgi:hypothetical protein